MGLKDELEILDRYICTPRVSKHRIFVWLSASTFPDSAVVAITVEDDYTFGTLHSRIHEVWSLRMGTYLGKGNDPRYTPTTCFETFPFPVDQPQRRQAISEWARHMHTVREQLRIDFNLTLTEMYNELHELREDRHSTHRMFPLLISHEKLDEAVAAAYGWEWPLEEEEILKRLLTLNLERVATEHQENAAD